MSIVASDIKVYGSVNMPDDDSSTNIGGAVDTTKKIEFTDIAPTGTVEALSSAAGDTTQTLTIVGRDASGVLQTETKTLTGATPVAFTTALERILKMTLSGTCTGTISIREVTGGEVLATMEPGILIIRRPFYNAQVPAGGTAKYYEKIFFKNSHATLTLTEAKIQKSADALGKVAFGMEAALGGSGTNGAGNNRQVAPTAIAFSGADQDVANSKNHTAGTVQGVWLELTLASTDPSLKSSFTMRETGITT